MSEITLPTIDDVLVYDVYGDPLIECFSGEDYIITKAQAEQVLEALKQGLTYYMNEGGPRGYDEIAKAIAIFTESK